MTNHTGLYIDHVWNSINLRERVQPFSLVSKKISERQVEMQTACTSREIGLNSSRHHLSEVGKYESGLYVIQHSPSNTVHPLLGQESNTDSLS